MMEGARQERFEVHLQAVFLKQSRKKRNRTPLEVHQSARVIREGGWYRGDLILCVFVPVMCWGDFFVPVP